MIISYIFLILSVIFEIIIEPVVAAGYKSENVTIFSGFNLENILLRRRRALVFPNGSSVKVTLALGKRLMVFQPKGFNFNIETAFYYPLPTSQTYLPLKKSDTKFNTKSTIFKNPIGGKWKPYWYELVNNTHWPVRPEYYSKGQIKYWKKQPSKLPFKYKPHSTYNFNNDFINYIPIEYPELRPFINHPHYRDHRERRDLFNYLESLGHILGIDVKSCILEVMCEINYIDILPGNSLLLDILRVIFTLPVLPDIENEYNNIMLTQGKECKSLLGNKCPFSTLNMIINAL